jgi:hypothetical protein
MVNAHLLLDELEWVSIGLAGTVVRIFGIQVDKNAADIELAGLGIFICHMQQVYFNIFKECRKGGRLGTNKALCFYIQSVRSKTVLNIMLSVVSNQ